MTPQEIRKHWTVKGKFPIEMVGDFALLEIAAQLSELNERLERLTTPGHELAVRTYKADQ